MHAEMCHRILERLSDNDVAARVMNEDLSQEDRQAAYEEFKRRDTFRKSTRNVKKIRHQLL